MVKGAYVFVVFVVTLRQVRIKGIHIDSYALDWPGTVQKNAITSTTDNEISVPMAEITSTATENYCYPSLTTMT